MFGWSLTRTWAARTRSWSRSSRWPLITILNIYGVKLVAIVNNTGVVFEILGMVVFAVFLAIVHNNQGVGVIFDGGRREHLQFPAPVSLVLPRRMFMSLYVIYGFDTASTLAEETRNPRREAPKAVLASVIGAFVIGAIFLWGVLIAVPDMGDAVTGVRVRAGAIIDEVMSSWLDDLYLLVVVGRDLRVLHVDPDLDDPAGFGMARDDQLPFSKSLSKVNPRLHTPVGRASSSGLLSAIPFIQFAGAAVIAVGATASIYLSYLLGNLAFMRARMKGGRRRRRRSSSASGGMVVNVVAILWGVAMMLNFLTPSTVNSALATRTRPAPTTCGSSRTRSRSRPTTTWRAMQLVDFKIDFLNKIPVIWTVFTVILIVGRPVLLARAEEEAVGARGAARGGPRGHRADAT